MFWEELALAAMPRAEAEIARDIGTPLIGHGWINNFYCDRTGLKRDYSWVNQYLIYEFL